MGDSGMDDLLYKMVTSPSLCSPVLRECRFSFWSYGSKNRTFSHMSFRSVLSSRIYSDGGNVSLPALSNMGAMSHMCSIEHVKCGMYN